MNSNSLETSLFDMMDIFMGKYYEYYNAVNNENNDGEIDIDELKNDCANYTEQLHCYLIERCNFITISKKLDTFIDKHINRLQDINFVMIAIKYLFQTSFFETILNTNYDSILSRIKSIFHINSAQILFVKITLAQKFVDEEIELENDKKVILELLIVEDIRMLKKIYDDIKFNPNLQEPKKNLMEFLCQHDLEDIYINDLETEKIIYDEIC